MIHVAVVPVRVCDEQARRALSFAGSLAPRVVALHVGEADGGQFEKSWDDLETRVPLVILDAPRQESHARMLAALEVLRRTEQPHVITVVIPGCSADDDPLADALRGQPGFDVRDIPADPL
jgi:hypothetical protein